LFFSRLLISLLSGHFLPIIFFFRF
jgi:hypothetical protein